MSDPNQLRNRVAWNTLSNFVGKVVVLALSFWLTPFIVRHLGHDLYGLWAIFGAVIGYSVLLDFGISGAIIRYVSGHRAVGEHAKAQEVISTALALYVLIGLVAVLVGLLLAPFLAGLFRVLPEYQQSAVRLVTLAFLGIGCTIPWIFTGAILRGIQRFDLLNLITVTGSLVYWLGMFVAMQTGAPVEVFAGVHLGMMALMAVLGVWQIRRTAPELKIRWSSVNRAVLVKIFTFSMALFVIALASQLQTQTDELVIGALLPVALVTPYYLARRLSEIPQSLTDQFMRVMLPVAAQLQAENDQARLRNLYLTSSRLTLAGFVPLAVALVVLARPLLVVWVGAEFAPYAHLIWILTAASLITTSQWPAGNILQSINRQKTLAWASGVSALSNLGLSIALIPALGVTGVALGTLVPAVLENLGFICHYTLKTMQVNLRTALAAMVAPAAIPAVPMAVTLVLLRQLFPHTTWVVVILEGAVGLAVYGLVYWWLGAQEIERQAVRDLAAAVRQFVDQNLLRWGLSKKEL